MKTDSFFATACLLLFALASCVSDDADYSHLESNPEAFGARMGRADALSGRDENYSRHLHRLHPDADEEDFEDAYEDAYEEGEEELEDREDSRDSYLSEAYDSGYSRGEGDRYRGLSRNPYRHEDAERGSPRFTRAWRDGYEDGWNDN